MKIKNNKSHAPAAVDDSEPASRTRILKYLILICIGVCIGVVAGYLLVPSLINAVKPVSHNDPDLIPVSEFENGQRYKAGPYTVLVLSGSYREMGRQYGSLMKPELQAMYQIVITEAMHKGYRVEALRNASHSPVELLPQRLKEVLKGMAETSGLEYDDLAILYYGAYFYDSLPTLQNGCSFLAVSGDYTKDGSMIVSRNFDLPDVDSVFDPYYTLVVYRPDDGSNGFATVSPAGMRAETLMNSKGLFISDNNGMASGGVDVRGNRPDFISEFYRFMLDCSTLRELDDDIQATRPNTAIIVNAAGPDAAYSYEESVGTGGVHLAQRSNDNGLLVATNHFVSPLWNNFTPVETSQQFSNTWITSSRTRYDNLEQQATQNKGKIDTQTMLAMRDVMLDNGGATVQHADFGGIPYSTDLQVVFVPQSQMFWMNVAHGTWQKINLGALFAR